MTRLRFYSDAALREPHTLADASQAQSMAVVMLGIESYAIVHDIELHSVGSPGQSDLRDARSRMMSRVRERLLGDPDRHNAMPLSNAPMLSVVSTLMSR